MGTNKVPQANLYSLCFKDDWHSDLHRAPKAAQAAFSNWASRILAEQPSIKTSDDSRFQDLGEVGTTLRSCALTKSSALVFGVDEPNRRVTLWMVDTPEAIETRLRAIDLQSRDETATFSAAVLDEWGLDKRYWNLLKDRPMVPRTILELEAQLGGELVSSLLQCLLPKSLSEVAQGPTRHVDPDQEIIGRQLDHFLLVLEPEQSAVLKRFTAALQRRPESAGGPWLLKGGPGSGKSTISLYCIQEILSASPGLFGTPPRVLFTTFTRALQRTSETLLDAWGASASQNITLKTINQLTSKYDARSYELLNETEERRDIIRDAIEVVTENCPFGDERGNVERDVIDFLFDEIEDFICGFGLTDPKQYFDLPRHRATPLHLPRRQYVWSLHEALTKLLKERKQTTFARRANHALANAKAHFDYVFIDEAQDLRPVQIRLCMKLCKTPTNLFLTADVNQGIYNTGTSWKSISDDLRFQGRSTVLKRNHRNTASIAAAIQLLAPKGSSADKETLNVDSRCIAGSKPILVCIDGSLLGTAAMNRVVNFLEDSAVRERVGFGCCAILVPTKRVGNEWAQSLPRHLNAKFFESKDMELQHPGVKILTIHSAKGLQFPVVAVVGLASDAISFLGPKDDPESADEIRRRLLFVACSRAMRHLLVQTSRSDPVELLSVAATRNDLWIVESLPSTPFNATVDDHEDSPF